MTFLILLVILSLIALVIVLTALFTENRYKNRVYRDWKQNNPSGTRNQFEVWWEDR